jgi:hypothetical protein
MGWNASFIEVNFGYNSSFGWFGPYGLRNRLPFLFRYVLLSSTVGCWADQTLEGRNLCAFFLGALEPPTIAEGLEPRRT